MFGLFKNQASELTDSVHEEIKQGRAIIIDVRESDEVESSHIIGAHWIPLSMIRSDVKEATKTIKDKFPNKKIYFYCRSGSRSQMATDIFRKEGVNGHNLGGINSLKGDFKTESGSLKCCG